MSSNIKDSVPYDPCLKEVRRTNSTDTQVRLKNEDSAEIGEPDLPGTSFSEVTTIKEGTEQDDQLGSQKEKNLTEASKGKHLQIGQRSRSPSPSLQQKTEKEDNNANMATEVVPTRVEPETSKVGKEKEQADVKREATVVEQNHSDPSQQEAKMHDKRLDEIVATVTGFFERVQCGSNKLEKQLLSAVDTIEKYHKKHFEQSEQNHIAIFDLKKELHRIVQENQKERNDILKNQEEIKVAVNTVIQLLMTVRAEQKHLIEMQKKHENEVSRDTSEFKASILNLLLKETADREEERKRKAEQVEDTRKFQHWLEEKFSELNDHLSADREEERKRKAEQDEDTRKFQQRVEEKFSELNDHLSADREEERKRKAEQVEDTRKFQQQLLAINQELNSQKQERVEENAHIHNRLTLHHSELTDRVDSLRREIGRRDEPADEECFNSIQVVQNEYPVPSTGSCIMLSIESMQADLLGRDDDDDDDDGSPGSDLQGRDGDGSPGRDLQGRDDDDGSPGRDLQGRDGDGSPGRDLRGRDDDDGSPGRDLQGRDGDGSPGRDLQGRDGDASPGRDLQGRDGDGSPGRDLRGRDDDDGSPGRDLQGRDGDGSPGRDLRGRDGDSSAGRDLRGRDGDGSPGSDPELYGQSPVQTLAYGIASTIQVLPGGEFNLVGHEEPMTRDEYFEMKANPHPRVRHAVRIFLHGCRNLMDALMELIQRNQSNQTQLYENLLSIACSSRIELARGCIILHAYPKSVKDARKLHARLVNGRAACELRKLLLTEEVMKQSQVEDAILDIVAVQQDLIDVIQELQSMEDTPTSVDEKEKVDCEASDTHHNVDEPVTLSDMCTFTGDKSDTADIIDLENIQDTLKLHNTLPKRSHTDLENVHLLTLHDSLPRRTGTVRLKISTTNTGDDSQLKALYHHIKDSVVSFTQKLQCQVDDVRWGCIILDLKINNAAEIQKLLARFNSGELLQIIKEIAKPVIGNTDSIQVGLIEGDVTAVLKDIGHSTGPSSEDSESANDVSSQVDISQLMSDTPTDSFTITGWPPQPVDVFVGYDSTLDKMYHAYKACKQDILEDVSKETLIHVLTGVAGIGKTEVAIQYAYRYHRDYPSGLYWINAATMTALDHGFSTMLQELDLEVTIDNDNMCLTADQTKCQILQWLESHPGWLLILDDVTNFELVKHYFPVLPSKGHIIITTRLMDFKKMVSVKAEELPIGPLSNAAAMKMLLCTQGISPKEVYLTLRRMEEEDGQNYVAFKQFSADLHGQPLSIMMAGSFTRKNLAKEENKTLYQHFWSQPITVQLRQLKNYNQYLGNLDDKLMCTVSDLQTDSDVVDLEKEDVETSVCIQIASHHFTSAWKLISNQLESRTDGPAAMELLQLMSYLSPTISKSLLISTSQQLKSSHLKKAMLAADPHIDSSHQDERPVEMKLSHLVTILCEHHLAMKSYGTTSFTVPRIIQDIIRQKLERKMIRRITAVNDAIQVLRANFPTISDMVGMTSPLASTQQEVIVHTSILHTHLTKSFVEEAKVEMEDPTSLLNDVGYYLRMMAKQPQAAVPIFETALHIAEVLLTLKPEREHHRKLSEAHYNLGSAYFDVSRVKDALREQEKGKELLRLSGVYDISQDEKDLFTAIQNQDEDNILELLPGIININAVSAEGLTFLHQAAIYNVSSFIRHVQNYHNISLLIGSVVECKESEFFNMKAIDISRKSFSEKLQVAIQIEESFSELHKVARQGGVEKLRELVQNMGNVDVLAHCDLTPLHVACGVGSLGIVKLLIQKGADVRRETSDAVTVLQKAVMYNHVEVVEYLLSRSEVRELIRHQDQKLNTVLHIAVKLNKGSQLVQLLVDEGACINAPNAKGYTPVHVAVKSHRVENLKVLLQNNPDIQTRDGKHWQAIHYAAESGHVDIIKVLLNHASRHHRVEEIANANCVLDCSDSVCLVKGKQNSKEVWHYVRVDVSKQPLFFNSWKRKTPLDVADFGKVLKSGWGSNPGPGVFQSIKKEYEEGDLDKIKQVTPLHLAARNAHIEAIKVLVREGGALVSAEDDRQQTPVHMAVLSGKLSAVKTLVEDLGADPNTEDSEGNTPEYLAKFNQLDDIECWFREYKARQSTSPDESSEHGGRKDCSQQGETDVKAVYEGAASVPTTNKDTKIDLSNNTPCSESETCDIYTCDQDHNDTEKCVTKGSQGELNVIYSTCYEEAIASTSEEMVGQMNKLVENKFPPFKFFHV
ncbi:uncharacterized protein LOC144434212 [Glandiceps talaboti]